MIVKKIKRLRSGRRTEKAKAAHIRDLTTYISAPGDAEKLLYLTSRGFVAETFSAQQAEMIALASEAVRSDNPVVHWVMSWREGERPTNEQIEEAITTFLYEMGLSEHQVIAGAHQDTHNMHVHIAVNRVHPETGKVIKPNRGFDVEAGHRAIARIERLQGWQPEENSRYSCDELGHVQRSDRRKERGPQPVAAARDMEVWTGQKSAQRIVQEEAAQIISRAGSWEEVHRELAARGMRYERKGSGALIVVGEVAVKASATKDRKCTLSALQKRLGEFEGAPADLIVVVREAEPTRQVKRRALWNEYSAARSAERAERDTRRTALRQRHTSQRRALLEDHRRMRAARLAGDWRGRGELRNALASLTAAEKAKAIADLRDLQAKERRQIARARLPSFEDWLRLKDSPEAAEAWRYQDAESTDWISGDTFVEPAAHDIRDFAGRVEGRAVRYAGGGAADAFVDRGRQVVVLRLDRAAVLASLQLSAAKWGSCQIHGGEQFKALCVELAAENGIRLGNPELQAAADALRAQAQKRQPGDANRTATAASARRAALDEWMRKQEEKAQQQKQEEEARRARDAARKNEPSGPRGP